MVGSVDPVTDLRVPHNTESRDWQALHTGKR